MESAHVKMALDKRPKGWIESDWIRMYLFER